MNQNKTRELQAIFLFIATLSVSHVSATQSNDILRFQGCPQNIIFGMYLDGGTSLVKVFTKENTPLFFGLENSNDLTIWNSKLSVTKKETELIEKNKTINVYVNTISPKTDGAQILPIKGEKETILRKKITSWLECENVSKKNKKELVVFVNKLDGKRIRNIVFELDEKKAKKVKDIRKLIRDSQK